MINLPNWAIDRLLPTAKELGGRGKDGAFMCNCANKGSCVRKSKLLTFKVNNGFRYRVKITAEGRWECDDKFKSCNFTWRLAALLKHTVGC